MTEEEQWNEAMRQLCEWEEKIKKANALLIDPIGKKDFDEVVYGCRITDYITVVEKPGGEDIHDPQGVFTEVWVDQHSVGDSGDSYAGFIYAKYAEKKWLKIPYDC